jgi:hypothetical protein
VKVTRSTLACPVVCALPAAGTFRRRDGDDVMPRLSAPRWWRAMVTWSTSTAGDGDAVA